MDSKIKLDPNAYAKTLGVLSSQIVQSLPTGISASREQLFDKVDGSIIIALNLIEILQRAIKVQEDIIALDPKASDYRASIINLISNSPSREALSQHVDVAFSNAIQLRDILKQLLEEKVTQSDIPPSVGRTFEESEMVRQQREEMEKRLAEYLSEEKPPPKLTQTEVDLARASQQELKDLLRARVDKLNKLIKKAINLVNMLRVVDKKQMEHFGAKDEKELRYILEHGGKPVSDSGSKQESQSDILPKGEISSEGLNATGTTAALVPTKSAQGSITRPSNAYPLSSTEDPDKLKGSAGTTDPKSVSTTGTAPSSKAPSARASTVANTSSKAPSARASAVENTSSKAPSARASAVENTSSKAPSARASAVENTSSKAPSARASGVENTSSKAPSARASGVANTSSKAPSAAASGSANTSSKSPSATASGVAITSSKSPSATATTAETSDKQQGAGEEAIPPSSDGEVNSALVATNQLVGTLPTAINEAIQDADIESKIASTDLPSNSGEVVPLPPIPEPAQISIEPPKTMMGRTFAAPIVMPMPAAAITAPTNQLASSSPNPSNPSDQAKLPRQASSVFDIPQKQKDGDSEFPVVAAIVAGTVLLGVVVGVGVLSSSSGTGGSTSGSGSGTGGITSGSGTGAGGITSGSGSGRGVITSGSVSGRGGITSGSGSGYSGSGGGGSHGGGPKCLV